MHGKLKRRPTNNIYIKEIIFSTALIIHKQNTKELN